MQQPQRPALSNDFPGLGHCEVVRIVQMPRPVVPALSNGFVGQGVLPTPEGATAATSITGMQGEHTSEVRGCVGVRIPSTAARTP